MRLIRNGAILAACMLALPSCTTDRTGDDATVVATSAGYVEGVVEDGVASWKGIPFAAPPVGELRWRAPQPVAAWSGVRDAGEYGHDCMQLPFPSDAAPLGTPPAEDCLYANVWKSADAGEGKLPVMVWIYGGGFVNGGSSPPTYSGAPLAEKGIMVVSFNYRVGRFGTFAHPQLTEVDADDGLIGNYGFMDQLAALRWVQENIAAFGGDPDNVTIVGESAGANSVHMLMTSPMAEGLFDRAVAMSGGNGRSWGGDLAEAERIGLAFARSKGISDNDPDALAKLRQLSADEVTDGLNIASLFGLKPEDRTHASPFIDGRVAMDSAAAYRDGEFAHVPMMIGATSADLGGPTGMMVSGARSLAGTLATQDVPVWEYRFSYVADSASAEGAEHATDIPFFFDTADIKYGEATTDTDNGIADLMSDYLVNFVRDGDPNGEELPEWPRYYADTDMLMDFSAEGEAVPEKDPLGPQLDAAADGGA